MKNYATLLPMIISILNLLVLTATLVAVIWYTVITHRMQQAVVNQVHELVHQRRLANLPAFVAEIKHSGHSDYLELTNIGKGAAINIVIDRVEIRFPTLEPGHIEFDKVLLLLAGEKVLIESREFTLGSAEGGNQNSLTFLDKHAHYDVLVSINFQDVEGSKYIQTLEMGKSGYKHGFVKLVEGKNSLIEHG